MLNHCIYGPLQLVGALCLLFLAYPGQKKWLHSQKREGVNCVFMFQRTELSVSVFGPGLVCGLLTRLSAVLGVTGRKIFGF